MRDRSRILFSFPFFIKKTPLIELLHRNTSRCVIHFYFFFSFVHVQEGIDKTTNLRTHFHFLFLFRSHGQGHEGGDTNKKVLRDRSFFSLFEGVFSHKTKSTFFDSKACHHRVGQEMQPLTRQSLQ